MRTAILLALLLVAPGIVQLAGAQEPARAAPTSATSHLPLVFEPTADGSLEGRSSRQMIRLETSRALLFGAADAAPIVMRIGEREPRPEARAPTGGVAHHLVGEQAAWRLGVPLYAEAIYRDAAPGVDVVFYDDGEGRPEFDLVAAPGSDVSALALRFDERVMLQADGSLLLRAPAFALRIGAPVAYQSLAGTRVPVEAHYAVDGHVARILVGAHDARLPLVVDPVIEVATRAGGSGSSSLLALGERGGQLALLGSTATTDMPTDEPSSQIGAGSGQAFVAVLSSDRSSIQRVTYLGGARGDVAYAGSFLADGSVVVFGYTQSEDFPTVNAAQAAFGGRLDLFAARLTPAGDGLVYATYLGGSDYEYPSGPRSLAVAEDGRAYLVARSTSPDFPVVGAFQPTRGGSQDGVVAVIGPAGALERSTYLGGAGSDVARAALLLDDALLVVGDTSSADFPGATQPARGGDAFLARITLDGGAVLSTRLWGGGNLENAADVVARADGAIAIVGQTKSYDFPLVEAAQSDYGGDCAYQGYAACPDAYATLFAPDGAVLASTRLGGSGAEDATRATFAADGSLWIAGTTNSLDLPLVRPMKDHRTSFADLFLARLAPAGDAFELVTYFGGDFYDSVNDVRVLPEGELAFVGSISEMEARGDQLSGQGDDALLVVLDGTRHAPSNPRDPSGSPMGLGLIGLAWAPPVFGGDSPVASYRIYRAPRVDTWNYGADTLVGETSERAFTDNTLAGAATWSPLSPSYRYTITAVNAEGESLASRPLHCYVWGANDPTGTAGRVGGCFVDPDYLASWDFGPALAKGNPDGRGWAAAKIVTDGAPFAIEITGWGQAGPGLMAVAVYDASFQLMREFHSSWSSSEPAKRLQLEVGDDRFAHDDRTIWTYGCGNLCGGTGIGMGLRTLAPGTYYLVAWTAGESESWEYSFTGRRGVAVLGIASGNDVGLFESDDFQATAGVVVDGAWAMAGGVIELGVEHALLARFAPGIQGMGRATGPDGSPQPCPCDWFTPMPSGGYAFHLDGASPTEAMLAYADVRFPE